MEICKNAIFHVFQGYAGIYIIHKIIGEAEVIDLDASDGPRTNFDAQKSPTSALRIGDVARSSS